MIRIEVESEWRGDAVRDDVLRRGGEVVRKLAEETAEMARANAPVASGRLREGIEVRPDGDDYIVVATAAAQCRDRAGEPARTALRRVRSWVRRMASAYGELPSVAAAVGLQATTSGLPTATAAPAVVPARAPTASVPIPARAPVRKAVS